MSTPELSRPNALLLEAKDLLDVLTSPAAEKTLDRIRIDWNTREIRKIPPSITESLLRLGLIEPDGERAFLSPAGLAFFGRLFVDVKALVGSAGLLAQRFKIEGVIAEGKNSVTFRALHKAIGRTFALKVLRPGAATNLSSGLEKIGAASGEPYLVHPIDYFSVPFESLNGGKLELECLVFPLVVGIPLDAYLRGSEPIRPSFLPAFINHVAKALAALEDVDAYHGDLHAGNILVTRDESGATAFRVIDVSFGIGHPSRYSDVINDFAQFQVHLQRIVRTIQRQLKSLSAKKSLGARLFTLIDRVASAESMSFTEVLKLSASGAPYAEYCDRRDQFLRDRFRKPQGFGLLRHEEIADPVQAVKLFTPYPELFRQLRQFGNAVVFGPRGCGKSTYLAALAFSMKPSPRADDDAAIRIRIEDIFGVYIACRQGEFRQFEFGSGNRYHPPTAARVKHIFILKVVRRCIGRLAEAVATGLLRSQTDFTRLLSFIEKHLSATPDLSISAESDLLLRDLHDYLVRAELLETDHIIAKPSARPRRHLLDEQILIEFCRTIRESVPELASTRFYFLFDDAGAPNVPRAAQTILNDLLRASNEVYCVKVSAERYSHTALDSGGKAMQEGHDYVSFDLAKAFNVGPGIDPERRRIEDHFRGIVHKRLEEFAFASRDITDYLGHAPIPVEELIKRLAGSKKDAYYCGWNVIWQLADRNPRALIEFVSDVLVRAGTKAGSPVAQISNAIQHAAIEAVSERRLRALGYVEGRLDLADRHSEPLGKHLLAFATAFGQMAHVYLTKQTPTRHDGQLRFDERIGIERNDSLPLTSRAQHILENLLRYAVVDDSKPGKSRDDQVRGSILVFNRTLCPYFRISFRRHTHLRLSHHRFEQLLLRPAETARSATAVLRKSHRKLAPRK